LRGVDGGKDSDVAVGGIDDDSKDGSANNWLFEGNLRVKGHLGFDCGSTSRDIDLLVKDDNIQTRVESSKPNRGSLGDGNLDFVV